VVRSGSGEGLGAARSASLWTAVSSECECSGMGTGASDSCPRSRRAQLGRLGFMYDVGLVCMSILQYSASVLALAKELR
jgi:hypothetical protein